MMHDREKSDPAIVVPRVPLGPALGSADSTAPTRVPACPAWSENLAWYAFQRL
jgi:hypothetical protein